MPALVIRPHKRPRDLRDAFIGVLAIVLIAAAAFLAGYLPLRPFAGPSTSLVGALVVVVATLGTIGLRTVTAIELDDTGIRFRRIAGRPRFLSWDNLAAVRRADRAEVVLRGWLLPPVALRACAFTLTSLGHYRLDWNGGSTYFPPADETALLDQLERNWGGVL